MLTGARDSHRVILFIADGFGGEAVVKLRQPHSIFFVQIYRSTLWSLIWNGQDCLLRPAHVNNLPKTHVNYPVKIPYPFQWGTPIFRASHVFGMMGAALVSSAESIGAFYAAARLSGATIPPAHVVSRSIGLQGIGQLLNGIFGLLVGSTASVENVGLLGLTRVGSRRAVELSTAFMIFFNIWKVWGLLSLHQFLCQFLLQYCVFYGIVAATGISFIQFTNPNSLRNIYIIGISLFLGISIPQYFVMNTDMTGHGPVNTGRGGWFNNILSTIFSSPPTVAIIVAMRLIHREGVILEDLYGDNSHYLLFF